MGEMNKRRDVIRWIVGSVAVLVTLIAVYAMLDFSGSSLDSPSQTGAAKPSAPLVDRAVASDPKPIAQLKAAAEQVRLATMPQWTVAALPFDVANPSEYSRYLSPVTIPLIALSEEDAKQQAEYAASQQPPKFIMSMCRDLQGYIWVGAEDEGVCRYDPSTGQWTRFTVKDGLGDNNGYAVACDRLGRIWAGHLNHGVSVYNGERWQNYEVVGGLSRPDTLSGPLGERIFDIAVCPADGDVWMATSAGLARYSEKQDTWDYLTRADGLPSDQASAIAFDAEGNIYVGTQCDGVTMADAVDGYKKWRTVVGPDRPGTTPTGTGLPTSLINDILVAKDGTVYAATTLGLAWSKDRGVNWEYVRGRDYADKVRHLPDGAPRSWREQSTWITEDYITCLTAGNNGQLWIGSRENGAALVDPAAGVEVGTTATGLFATAILSSLPSPVIGTYGDQSRFAANRQIVIQKLPIQQLPAAAATPTIAAVEQMTASLKGLSAESQFPIYFGEDWATRGDWHGRYGRYYTILAAMSGFNDVHSIVALKQRPYTVTAQNGPFHKDGDTLRLWLQWEKTDNPGSLYWPMMNWRRQADWDDHGEAYSRGIDGPDLWITVTVPEGIHRVGLYFINYNGHDGLNRFRDYVLELYPYHQKDADDPVQRRGLTPPSKSRALEDLPASLQDTILARARVRDFGGGVYKQFIIQGPKPVLVRVRRNFSHNAICSGVFVDPLSGPALEIPTKPMTRFGKVRLDDASLPREPFTESTSTRMTQALWDSIKSSVGVTSSFQREREFRLAAYRLVSVEKSAAGLAAYWRWNLPIWNESDRKSLSAMARQGWSEFAKANKALVNRLGASK
jgi:hypothetical protein